VVRSFRDDVLTFLSRDETVPADGESTPVFSRRTPKGAKTSRLKPLKHPRKGLTKSTSPANRIAARMGLMCPVAAIPRLSPTTISPLATPFRSAGTCGRNVAATRTIVAPVATPDRNRQEKYHSNEIGHAHANNDRVASTFMPRKMKTLLHRRANQVDVTAPNSAPAGLAALK